MTQEQLNQPGEQSKGALVPSKPIAARPEETAITDLVTLTDPETGYLTNQVANSQLIPLLIKSAGHPGGISLEDKARTAYLVAHAASLSGVCTYLRTQIEENPYNFVIRSQPIDIPNLQLPLLNEIPEEVAETFRQKTEEWIGKQADDIGAQTLIRTYSEATSDMGFAVAAIRDAVQRQPSHQPLLLALRSLYGIIHDTLHDREGCTVPGVNLSVAEEEALNDLAQALGRAIRVNDARNQSGDLNPKPLAEKHTVKEPHSARVASSITNEDKRIAYLDQLVRMHQAIDTADLRMLKTGSSETKARRNDLAKGITDEIYQLLYDRPYLTPRVIERYSVYLEQEEGKVHINRFSRNTIRWIEMNPSAFDSLAERIDFNHSGND